MAMEPAGRPETDPATAGVIARPPLVFAAALLMGVVLDRLLPLPVPAAGSEPLSWIAGGAAVLAGVALATAGIRNFATAQTPVPTSQPTRALVTTGIHRFTRNPIYLGMFVLYGGIGIAARSPWILVLV